MAQFEELLSVAFGRVRPQGAPCFLFYMSEDEIAIMDGGKCILQLRGVRTFFSEKFDITKHPHYKYLADADKKNTFDVDRFLSTLRRKRQQVVAQDESFDLYEIDLPDEDAAAE